MEEMQGKRRTRVISTDKLDQSTIKAIEASPPAPAQSKPAAPVVADTKPVSPSPSPAGLAAAPSAVFAAPNSSPGAVTSAAPPSSQPAANIEAKKEKRLATKSKRKPKAPAIQEAGDDGTTSLASSDSDDLVSDDRSRRRDDRSVRRLDRRRIVERWTERDYDVPASNGDGQRRVTVIRRNGGGLFESLFGN
jgi:hypothetical protein